MSRKWHVAFVTSKLEDTLTLLVKLKVTDLEFKPIVEQAPKTALKTFVDLVTDTPQSWPHIRDAMRRHGVSNGALYNTAKKAVEQKLVRRTKVKGVTSYVRIKENQK